MSQFPDKWQILPLEDCLAALIDYRGKSPNKKASGIPLITAKVVKAGRIEKTEEFIAEDEYDEWMQRGLPKPGDVVMTTEAPLGEIAQLDGQKVALAQRLITLRGKEQFLDNTYLKFLMQSEFVQDELKARATGTTVLGIRQSELRKVPLVIPPFPEQRAIASVLGALDDKIELNRRMNETLEALAQSRFKSWFVDATQSALPKGWREGKVSDICTTQYGYTASATDEPVGPHFLRVMDINKRNWIDWSAVPYCPISDEDKSRYSLSVGDIVVARMADPGKSAIVEQPIDAVFASYLVRLKTESLAHAYYLYHFLKSQAYTEYSQGAMSGSVQANMNAKVIVDAGIPIPPIALMKAFLEKVLPLRQRIAANSEESRTLAALRDALLPKLLSGELRVPAAAQLVEARA